MRNDSCLSAIKYQGDVSAQDYIATILAYWIHFPNSAVAAGYLALSLPSNTAGVKSLARRPCSGEKFFTFTPVRKLVHSFSLHSEQQAVDCDPQSYGCDGGWYDYAWSYLKGGAATAAFWTGNLKECEAFASLPFFLVRENCIGEDFQLQFPNDALEPLALQQLTVPCKSHGLNTSGFLFWKKKIAKELHQAEYLIRVFDRIHNNHSKLITKHKALKTAVDGLLQKGLLWPYNLMRNIVSTSI